MCFIKLNGEVGINSMRKLVATSSRYEYANAFALRPSVSGNDHQPLRLVVVSIPLSFRNAEKMMAACGIVVSCETMRLISGEVDLIVSFQKAG